MAAERADLPGSWQFPQGGVDAGETEEEAVLREMREELGLNADEFEIVAKLPQTVKYDFPPEIAQIKPHLAKFAGQEQTIFILRFLRGARPNLKKADGELRDWKFMRMEDVPPLAVNSSGSRNENG
jgi:putative (di)nucleoside polyphosphate hydrolase